MKLTRITKPLRSVQVRVTVAGELNAGLGNYARYYEHVHGDSVEPRALIPEMLRAFIEGDREFQHGRAPAPTAASTGPPPRLCRKPPRRHKCDYRIAASVDTLGAAPRA
jgi:hypothetical protein